MLTVLEIVKLNSCAQDCQDPPLQLRRCVKSCLYIQPASSFLYHFIARSVLH